MPLTLNQIASLMNQLDRSYMKIDDLLILTEIDTIINDAKINIMEKLSKTENDLIDSLAFDRESTETESVENVFTGESCELDARGVALHDFIKGCEAWRLYTKLQFGLTLFRKLYPDEYYILLD